MSIFSRITERVGWDGEETESITDDNNKIKFLCQDEDYGVIAEPQPANNVLPDWYKSLGGKLGEGIGQSTVKRCAPFLDSMTAGWIIPLAGEVEFHYNPETGDFSYDSKFDKKLLETHDPEQIGGEKNPMTNMPILKFINHWAIKVPDGYSVLIMSPLNRMQHNIQAFSGIVDADEYFNRINFPALWTGGAFSGVIDKGSPLVQVIPIKRETMIGDGTIRKMDEDELVECDKTTRRIATEESLYRSKIWQPKEASRVLDRDEIPDKENGADATDDSKCPFH